MTHPSDEAEIAAGIARRLHDVIESSYRGIRPAVPWKALPDHARAALIKAVVAIVMPNIRCPDHPTVTVPCARPGCATAADHVLIIQNHCGVALRREVRCRAHLPA